MPVAVLFGSSEPAVGDRVVEVVAEDGEHPVEREALPQLDTEEVGKTDRVTEQGAFGGRPSVCPTAAMAVTLPLGRFGAWRIAATPYWAKAPQTCLQEFHAAQHISLRGLPCGHTAQCARDAVSM